MAVQCIGRHKNLVVVERQAERLTGFGHLTIHGLRTFPAKLRRAVSPSIQARFRQVGIEFKGPPDNVRWFAELQKL